MSAFINANYERIEALEPDLVLGFSDLQADIASDLVKRGYPVMIFNQRTVAEILQMIRVVGALVGAAARADALADRLEMDLDFYRSAAATLSRIVSRVGSSSRGSRSPSTRTWSQFSATA